MFQVSLSTYNKNERTNRGHPMPHSAQALSLSLDLRKGVLSRLRLSPPRNKYQHTELRDQALECTSTRESVGWPHSRRWQWQGPRDVSERRRRTNVKTRGDERLMREATMRCGCEGRQSRQADRGQCRLPRIQYSQCGAVRNGVRATLC